MWIPLVAGMTLVALAMPSFGGGPEARSDAEGQDSKTSTVDLVQTQLNLPGKVKIGKTFQVLDQLENVGEFPAGVSVTYFYLSKDDTLDAADVAVAGRRVPPLGPTRAHGAMTPVTLKPPIEPGVYYFIAMADAERTVEERYDSNNTRAVKVTVQPADPPKKK